MKTKATNDRGAITLYLLIVMLAMIFLLGSLFDMARVMAAKKALERAANASARSVLADYNTDLRSYGLYGLADKSKAGTRFSDYLDKNLAKTGFFDYKIESTSVDEKTLDDSSLGDQAILKQQILQEMKYRAPIELTTKLVAAFRPFGKMAGQYSKANEIGELQKKRQDAIDNANKTISDKCKKYLDIDDNSSLEKESKDFFDKWSDLGVLSNDDFAKADFSSLKKSLGGINSFSSTNTLRKYMDDVINDINDAKAEDDKVSAKLAEPDPSYDIPSTGDEPPDATSNSIDTKLYGDNPEEYKSKLIYKQQLDDGLKVVKELSDQIEEIETLSKDLSDAITNTSLSNIKKYAAELNTKITALKGNLHKLNGLNLPQPIQPTFTDNVTGEKIKVNDSNAEHQIDTSPGHGKLPDGVTNKTSLMDKLDKISDDIGKQFKYATELGSASKHFRELAQENDLAFGKDDYSTDHARKKLLKFIEDIFSKISNINYSVRDTLYINEFALSKYSCFTEPHPTGDIPDPVQKHVLSNSEIEYVIYGNGSPALDLGAAFGELFMVRMAMNTLYHFSFNPNPDPTMISRVLIAVGFGAVDTVGDMSVLLFQKDKDNKAGSVAMMGQWGKYGKYGLPLTYKDYMRLFMLIHGNNDKLKLARIQSVISLNTEDGPLNPPTLLKDTATVGTFKAQASIRLWFIPTVMSGVGKVAGFEVKDNRAIVTQSVTASY